MQAAPRSEPGLLHGFSDDYFKRIEAVEFAVRHDDGANLHTLFQADLVLTGVSRTSKTPLSMYLAQRGYKTGNVPIVPGIDPPRELLELDPQQGVRAHDRPVAPARRSASARVRALGAPPYSTYADPEALIEEVRRARRLYREQGWQVVDISGRAAEENAARILRLIEEAGVGSRSCPTSATLHCSASRRRGATAPRPSAKTSSAWAGIAERGSMGALRFIRWVYRTLRAPRDDRVAHAGRRLLLRDGTRDAPRVAGLSAHALGRAGRARGARRAAHLAPRLPPPARVRRAGPRPHDRLERRHRDHPGRLRRHRDPARARRSSGRGAILLGSHLGSYDLLRSVAEQTGVTLNVLIFTRERGAHQRVLRAAAPGLEAAHDPVRARLDPLRCSR